MTDIDIVIPLSSGSNFDNAELKYCLRSIEKYLTGYRNVYIIGELPKWIKNVVHIPAKDKPGSEAKASNIFNKLRIAAQHPDISETFFHIHDDHFLLQPIEASNFPYHHIGNIMNHKRRSGESYGYVINNTINLLGRDINNFDTHAPILYEKSKILQLPDRFPVWGYLVKTLYCVTHGIKGEYYPDMKIITIPLKEILLDALKNRMYFSIADAAFRCGIMKVFEELYPKKSIYEK